MLNLLRPVSILQKCLSCPSTLTKANYASDSLATVALGKAKKKAGKGGSSEKIKLPVETDTNRLVNYVCGSNLLKEGGEDVKIGPDSEYPDWLWNVYTGPAKKLSELEPDSLELWKKVLKLEKLRKNKIAKLRSWN